LRGLLNRGSKPRFLSEIKTKGEKIMDKTKINAGFIVQLEEEDWRELEEIIREKVKRLIFVKKCPITVKLEIKENFPTRKGENGGLSNSESD
jgi:hypothetical protein